MRKMGLNRNYIVGIYDDTQFSNHLSKSQKFKEITEFFTRFKYFGPIIVEKSVNAVLDKALEYDVDYCIVQSVGHIIMEASFFTHIETWIDKRRFFVTGHIMDKNKKNKNNPSGSVGYYGLHKQCMLVNLDYYKKFDKPVFGEKSSKEERVTKAKRHAKDIHDDYTPLSLTPTEESTVCTPLVDGWNFINKSLENGLTVYNFHPKIRNVKQYLYPNLSAAELSKQLSWINNIVEYAPTCVFFWNTENYTDLKYLDIKPIDTLYCVAASFKPNMILHKFNFNEKSKVVFFDYSKQSLAFKKLLVQEWDGEDYPSFLDWAYTKFKFNETGGAGTETMSRSELWQREISWWGSEKEIKEHWNRYKKLDHDYVYADICENPQKVTNKITGTGNEIIWWSNAFHTVNAQYLRGLAGVRQCYETWTKQIVNKNPNIWILGKDYLDRPVEGKQVKDYLDDYSKLSKTI